MIVDNLSLVRMHIFLHTKILISGLNVKCGTNSLTWWWGLDPLSTFFFTIIMTASVTHNTQYRTRFYSYSIASYCEPGLIKFLNCITSDTAILTMTHTAAHLIIKQSMCSVSDLPLSVTYEKSGNLLYSINGQCISHYILCKISSVSDQV